MIVCCVCWNSIELARSSADVADITGLFKDFVFRYIINNVFCCDVLNRARCGIR